MTTKYDRGLFYTRTTCCRCEDKRRRCMWVFKLKGWVCWLCAGTQEAV